MTTATRPCGLAVDGSAALIEDIGSGLAVVPLHILIGEQEFIDDGHTDTYASFYRALRESGVGPTTSTPAPGEYLDAFRRTDAEHTVCLTIPARWSGMYRAASVAAAMLAEAGDGRQATVVETGTAIGGLALVARVAAELCARGAPAPEVAAAARAASEAVRLFGSLATLTYVARSGRVNSLIAGISNSLHVRPVFKLRGGETGRVALTRTVSGAVDALQKVAGEQLEPGPQRLLVWHADAEGEARQLAERLGPATPADRIEVVALSPVGGAYTGPGAFGFAALPAGPGQGALVP